MSASLRDIVQFGDTPDKGPIYNRSQSVLSVAYIKILNVTPGRKFLFIKPTQHPVRVHFLSPDVSEAGASFVITDGNSIIVHAGNADPFLMFDKFVPSNAVYMKSNSTTDVVIYEA